MLTDVIDLKMLYTIAHIFGAVIGAGGAYMSDMMFLSTMRDQRISPTELRFLSLGSRMVWGGLALLTLSGIGLFSTDPVGYLYSTKFIAKMSIVLIIILNGLIFYRIHHPRMERHENEHLPSSDEFRRTRVWLLISGAISVTSWSVALVLGVLRGLSFTYLQIIGVYGALLIIACVGALTLRNYVIPLHTGGER